ncbi:sensor histidine kinase [Duganella sp. Root198D2]|uniref:sensor histidine kinase n=1 Tax=Duganella sp. Root198D2 TaxID=1736489 RepID=UPI0009EC75B2|nr:sensor histidine kinase [Duganella sp. Root198D2]
MIQRALQYLFFLCLATVLRPALAEAPGPLLVDYTHTAWNELDGAPAGATKFAQGADGWLWISSPTGLYRFDGVSFERTERVFGHQLESSNVMALAAAPDGALWVGYRAGGVSVFRKNGAHTYTENDGLQPVGALHIEVAPDGATWVAMRDGVAVLPAGGKRFHHLGPEAGLPTLGVFQILFSRDGTTWVGTNTGAFFRPQGEARFKQAWPRKTLVSLAEAPDGTIWGNDFERGYYKIHTAPPASNQAVLPEVEGALMRFDRRGAMWITQPDGLERRLDPAKRSNPAQRLSIENGISGPMIGALLEDREGSLWIATSQGIDRLRPNRLRTVPLEKQLEFPALVSGPSGDLWVGDYAGDLWSFSRAGRIKREVAGKLTASYTGPDGVLWLGGMDGVVRRATDGVISMIRFPDELKTLRIHAMQQDLDGALWVAISSGKGVYKIVDGKWIKWGGVQGIPDLLTTSMARDQDGNLWMAHLRSLATIISNGKARTLGAEQGLQLGTVMTLYADAGNMWAGGEKGVALYRNGRFAALLGEHAEGFRGVSGIVRMPGGDLWLHGADGLYRVPAAGLAAWMKDARKPVAFERFDAHDGMKGHAPQLRPVPSLKLARDGFLWYATTGSVGTIDPQNILRNPIAPPVEVVGVTANGQRYAIPERHLIRLPEGTRSLQVDFTALSLALPERVRLRYRLAGMDREWQEAVGRRQAYFTNLAPGKYRFEVNGSNEDGLWNSRGAVLEIDIPPTFIESTWFKLLMVFVIVMTLFIAYAMRLHYLTRQMQERMLERMAERSRIARALHDTLLQSVQSLLLSFDAHSRYLKEGSPERDCLNQTLDFAEKLLVEGRDQILDLRASASQEHLEQILGQFGKGLAAHGAHAFEVNVDGSPRQLRQQVHDELYAIAREGLFNASRYAGASRIELAVEYSSDSVNVRIADNGRGLDASVVASGHRPGHWGLVGMRERAGCIGAEIEIDSKPGEGTTISVTVPAQKAY